MKVSEAIDRLAVGDTVWAKATVNAINFEGGYIRAENTKTSIYLDGDAEISLTEPQAEKVEVSQEFADWVEKCMAWKHDGSWAAKEIAGYGWGDFMHDLETEEKLLPNKYPWVNDVQKNEEKYIKAIYDGYTVKPKRWVVRQGGSEVWYLQGFRNSLDGDIVKQWCSHEGCIKFTDKAKAEAIATLVEGSVEEV